MFWYVVVMIFPSSGIFYLIYEKKIHHHFNKKTQETVWSDAKVNNQVKTEIEIN